MCIIILRVNESVGFFFIIIVFFISRHLAATRADKTCGYTPRSLRHVVKPNSVTTVVVIDARDHSRKPLRPLVRLVRDSNTIFWSRETRRIDRIRLGFCRGHVFSRPFDRSRRRVFNHEYVNRPFPTGVVRLVPVSLVFEFRSRNTYGLYDSDSFYNISILRYDCHHLLPLSSI